MRTVMTAVVMAAVGAIDAPAVAQDGTGWMPAAGRLMTRWGKEVTPENAWREYPRPQLVREHWLSLNGLWKYSVTAVDAPEPQEFARAILVPYPIESVLSGVGTPLDPGQRLWYRRGVVIPPDWKGQRVLLHFGAVDWSSQVWVNGRSIGSHTGGYDPFSFDITESLHAGENTVTVAVTDPTDEGGQPRGKQWLKPNGIWYTRTSGIWQSVWLEPVGEESIESIVITPDAAHGRVTVAAKPAAVRPGRTIRTTVRAAGRVITGKLGAAGEPVVIDLPAAHAWSPDDPFLYDLSLDLLDGEVARDSVRSYFGLRDVSVATDGQGINRIMLNGKSLFEFGPLDQGFWPDGIYTPPSDEAMKFDIEAVKKMGGNMLRKHVKVEPDRFYAWCDRLGVLVWQDMPSPFFPKEESAGVDWHANYESELHRLIDTHRNHPSIIMWVPFNEGWGQHETQKYVALVKEWDPTRLVNNASGWTDTGVGDVIDIHSYPGPGMATPEPRRAGVLGEFGGLGLPIEGHTWEGKNNWGYVSFKNREELTAAYVGLVKQIPLLIGQGLCAAVYTQTTDCEIECNGWLTYDREVWKIDPERAAQAAAELYRPPPLMRVVVARAGQNGPHEWWYTTANPGDDWFVPGFSPAKAGWKQGEAGFGARGTPGAIIGAEWNTGDIWIRRDVRVDALPTSPHLSIHHDEDAEVYLNGHLAATLKGYTTSYAIVPLDVAAAGMIKIGENTIAIHCHQTQGGQCIDCGIVDLVPGK